MVLLQQEVVSDCVSFLGNGLHSLEERFLSVVIENEPRRCRVEGVVPWRREGGRDELRKCVSGAWGGFRGGEALMRFRKLRLHDEGGELVVVLEWRL